MESDREAELIRHAFSNRTLEPAVRGASRLRGGTVTIVSRDRV